MKEVGFAQIGECIAELLAPKVTPRHVVGALPQIVTMSLMVVFWVKVLRLVLGFALMTDRP